MLVAVVVVNHGVKRVLVVRVKVLSVHHNGVKVGLSSDQPLVHTVTNYL
ncbi:50S ribosomal protein L1E (L4P), partial [Salmonella enterica subsp. enterica serovar Agona str. SH10GFN094]